jgi:hypothetical protein
MTPQSEAGLSAHARARAEKLKVWKTRLLWGSVPPSLEHLG